MEKKEMRDKNRSFLGKKGKKILTAITCAAMLMGMTGCGSSSATGTTTAGTTAADTTASTTTAATEAQKNVSGTVRLAGSTSMQKLSLALQEAFQEKYPNTTVTVEFIGSSAGIESLTSGSTDIGNASRALSDKEKSAGAVENVVAIDGIAVITDKANKVTDITSEQLASIYKGEVTNWKDLGGDDEVIVVIGREAGSGTRGAFEELLKIEDACKYANELDTTGAVLAKVAATPGAIGYVSLDVVDDSVIAMAIDGVEATEANIVAGQYALSRPFVMATMGEISAQSDIVKTFFDYIKSEEGQSVIKQVGLILPE